MIKEILRFIIKEILRFLRRALCLSTFFPAAPLPPLLPRDRQGTEPGATGILCAPRPGLDRLSWQQEKVDPQPEPPCSLGPRSCSEAQGHSPVMGVKGSTGGLCWEPSRSHPQLVSGAQVGAASAHFGVFLKGKPVLEVLGLPSTRYNKLHKAQIPCPVQNLQAGRQGSNPSSGDKTRTHGRAPA